MRQMDRYLSDDEIEAQAARILQQYGRQYRPIVAPPVPIEDIIDFAVDLPIIRDSIPDVQGAQVLAKLVARGHPNPLVEIVLNEDKQLFFDQYTGTEQYSLAHELGHYVLHIDRGSLETLLLPQAQEQSIVLCRTSAEAECDRNAKRRELQAERFAACILMPQDLVRTACGEVDIYHWPNLYALKNQFRVTISALTNRLKELHLVTITPNRKLVPYQQQLVAHSPSLWE